jgi:hypothetical protein
MAGSPFASKVELIVIQNVLKVEPKNHPEKALSFNAVWGRGNKLRAAGL